MYPSVIQAEVDAVHGPRQSPWPRSSLASPKSRLLCWLSKTALQLSQELGLAYWIKITTQNPECTYFFGPFLSEFEAQQYWSGYVEDLTHEGAADISVHIDRCRPSQLTILES